MMSVGQHSVEVDPKVSQMTGSFDCSSMSLEFQAGILATAHSVSFPVVFRIVRIQYSFSLQWSFPGLVWGSVSRNCQSFLGVVV